MGDDCKLDCRDADRSSQPPKDPPQTDQCGRVLNPPPTPLSQLPTPGMGQTWHLAKLEKEAKDAWRCVQNGDACYDRASANFWFKTLIGNFGVPPGSNTPALPDLGLYFWFIPPWYDDEQLAHKQDEAYMILDGHGEICVQGRRRQVRTGDLIFVPRCAEHKFFTPFEQSLTILIIFTPPYTSASMADPIDTSCCDREYQKKAWTYADDLRRKYDAKHCNDQDYQPCFPKSADVDAALGRRRCDAPCKDCQE